MTNNQKEKLSNSKIFGMFILAAAAVASVSVMTMVSSQNVMATICPPMCDEDIAVEEAAEAGNATTMMAE